MKEQAESLFYLAAGRQARRGGNCAAWLGESYRVPREGDAARKL